MTHQRPGIDLGGYGNSVIGKKALGIFFRSPIARDARKLPHHQALDVGPRRFLIVGIRAVISNLRVRENDDLAGV